MRLFIPTELALCSEILHSKPHTNSVHKHKVSLGIYFVINIQVSLVEIQLSHLDTSKSNTTCRQLCVFSALLPRSMHRGFLSNAAG